MARRARINRVQSVRANVRRSDVCDCALHQKKALGSVSGIVGAGGNFGAMLAGFMFKYGTEYFSQAYMFLGMFVIVSAFGAFAVRFSPEQEAEAKRETKERLATSLALAGGSN